MKNNFSTYEALLLKDVYEIIIECAKTAKTPLLRDHMKALRVAVIRCFTKRGNTYMSQIIVSDNDLKAMVEETKSIFANYSFREENDFFWKELLKIETQFMIKTKTE